MDSRQPELSRLTLMCSDHEVAEFTWNHDRHPFPRARVSQRHSGFLVGEMWRFRR